MMIEIDRAESKDEILIAKDLFNEYAKLLNFDLNEEIVY